MTSQPTVRPGGRSARIQQAVHQAVRELESALPRDELTVPRIAEYAGVTPSTLYRRWGNLTELLADVKLEHMRSDQPLVDTGTLAGDLQAWGKQYYEEMASNPGQLMLRDIVASSDDEQRLSCCNLARAEMHTLIQRAQQRNETTPSVDTLMDRFIAPLIYYLLYDTDYVDDARLERWIATALA
ncbi:TetR/AcrR family transcriptional regulator [Salinisphaera sp. USBA-960]|nr:TetR/AcrR family transcriptional regulator [Salifodinibacter halophilus]NNC26317.1 TetR/AcrR family transcriptional regulator [Salifodinibacter halophilus]